MSVWICGWNAIFMYLDQETRSNRYTVGVGEIQILNLH